MYIVWATPSPPTLGRTCSALLFSSWRENIRDNKKAVEFLLVWDKDSYTERFLTLLPCTRVLEPMLVNLYQTSSLLPSPLPIVVSASLRLLYLLLYSEHINHIQVLDFLLFPYSSHELSPLTVFWISSFEKALFNSVDPFFIGSLIFGSLVFWAPCIFWLSVLCLMYS
jgi:hypothetical protein